MIPIAMRANTTSIPAIQTRKSTHSTENDESDVSPRAFDERSLGAFVAGNVLIASDARFAEGANDAASRGCSRCGAASVIELGTGAVIALSQRDSIRGNSGELIGINKTASIAIDQT